MEVLVEHWWNGLWGSLMRRDVYLKRYDGLPTTWWCVEVQRGGADSGRFSASPDYTTEDDARAELGRQFSASPGGRWVNVGR